MDFLVASRLLTVQVSAFLDVPFYDDYRVAARKCTVESAKTIVPIDGAIEGDRVAGLGNRRDILSIQLARRYTRLHTGDALAFYGERASSEVPFGFASLRPLGVRAVEDNLPVFGREDGPAIARPGANGEAASGCLCC